MQKLVHGIHHFQKSVFDSTRELFEQLELGQKPEALFITCADSRIVPNLVTQTQPGELFSLRNAGNLVPAYGAGIGGEAATIEFAVDALGVKDIIICGHSHCGAMKGLLYANCLQNMPATTAWLKHAEATRQIIKSKYSDLTDEALLNATIEENVLVQLENLRTHPCVAAALSVGKVHLHAWVYVFEEGQVYVYSAEEEDFLPISQMGKKSGGSA